MQGKMYLTWEALWDIDFNSRNSCFFKKKGNKKLFSALETAWNSMVMCLLVKAWRIEAFLWLGGSKEVIWGSGHSPCLWFLSNSTFKNIKLSPDIGIKHVSKIIAGGLSEYLKRNFDKNYIFYFILVGSSMLKLKTSNDELSPTWVNLETSHNQWGGKRDHHNM